MLRTVIPFQLRVRLSIFLIPCGERNSNGCDWLISPSLAAGQTEDQMNPSKQWAQIKNSKITEDVKAETDQKQRNPTRCKICGGPYLLYWERRTPNEVSASFVPNILLKRGSCALRHARHRWPVGALRHG